MPKEGRKIERMKTLRGIVVALMAMLWVNGIAAAVCTSPHSQILAVSGAAAECATSHHHSWDSGFSLIDCDSLKDGLQLPEAVDSDTPLRMCNTSPARVLPLHSCARTLLARGSCDFRRRELAARRTAHFSASITFPLRFFASERVVVLKRINC